jgi:predicted lipoprotein with Yx(FWY)xxD motif
MRRILWPILLGGLVCALTVAAGAQGRSTAQRSRAVVKTAFNKKLKKVIVVDGAGRTLYMFTADVHGKPGACAGLGPSCLKAWPAYTSKGGAPIAGKGIKASLLKTASGPGAKRQVVYNHHPLYHFAGGQGLGPGDRHPGQIKGQGVDGVWFVLSARGKPIKSG